ncbi:MAG: AbrB/MazE/SpoVT family DNA-binding domain-containing protein [Candidatus Daviesbacteria bacterium]|nr:AbrB/MazE/SpoVT family DNA-binding domain-containing protein [Candidatus Daviesbacteria bacterium]
MNIGTIVTPNIKGQIVIPKKIRDGLNITKNTPLNIRVVDNGIHIHPIAEVITNAEEDKRHRVLLQILKETQGAWANDKEFDKRQKKMRKMEIAATKRMRKTW